MHICRNRPKEHLPERLRLLSQIFLEQFITTFVQEHSLIVSVVDLFMERKKGTERHCENVSAEDFFILNFEHGSLDFPADHGRRVLIISKIVGGKFCIGENESGRVLCTAGTARTLHIICRTRRHIAHIYRLKASHIHSHLKSSRTAESVDFFVDKRFLVPRLLILRQLRSVLFDEQRF